MNLKAFGVWLSEWDPWPLIRLVAVFIAAALWLHWRFQLTMPSPRELARIGAGLFETFCVCAVLSAVLADLFLVVLMFPLYATIVLQDWFYDASHWLLRLFLGPRSPRLTAGLALAGELGLFLGLWRSVELFLMTYCRW